MKKLFIIVFLTLGICSCDILKESSKEKKDVKFDESIETREKRKGDTATYWVPNIKYKDTVIYTTSTQGTVLKTYYDNKGEIYKSDCISSEIELLKLEIRSLTDQSKVKESSKEEKTDSTWMYVIGAIIAFVMLCVFLLIVVALFFYLKFKR